RTFRKTDLAIILLSGVALGSLHPIPATILVFSLGVTAGLKWLASPDWALLKRLMPLGAALVFLMVLPFVQRFAFFGVANAPNMGHVTGVTATRVSSADTLVLPNIPILGTTYIRRPSSVFYSPIIIIAVVIGLMFGLCWRRTLTAQYVFG